MKNIEAVIFDMDGVLANTEPLWRKAMIEEFNEAGVVFTEAECRLTTGMRLKEVVEYWHIQNPLKNITPTILHDKIINNLCGLIRAENIEMKGSENSLRACQNLCLPTGLATSSNYQIINTVLKKINRDSFFKVIESAEGLKYGKPHPEVFLNCANKLNVDPTKCLVIEDSVNGIIAAKAAGMRVAAVPDPLQFIDPRFSIADYKFSDLEEFSIYLQTNYRF